MAREVGRWLVSAARSAIVGFGGRGSPWGLNGEGWGGLFPWDGAPGN
jgi:hypothetical protein